jgi:aryl-alcohol dehydrogenase-like predicted oxidoreductase
MRARHNAPFLLPKFRDQDFSMQIRNLGGSGLRVSAVGLGCNNFGQRVDLEGSRRVIHKALDLGITLFDTADIYSDMGGSENVLGAVLGDRRKDIVLATKYSKPMAADGTRQGASRRYIMNAVEASLKRLKTDYIDLYQQHDYDPLTPIEESLRALDDLVRQGKVRYIGNSNFPAWRVAEAEYVARAMNVSRFVSCQDEYSLVVRDIEKDLLPAAEEYDLGILPFFPLASGLLTGKYKRGEAAPGDTRFGKVARLRDRYVTPRNEEIVEKLQAFAQARGHSMLELAFSWLAARPQVSSVIAGATRVEQVEQNVKAIAWNLSAEEMKEIDGITQ